MAATHREQFNIEVSPRMMLIARQLALIEDASVPQLLRPVLETWLEAQVEADPDLRELVEASTRARDKRARAASTVRPLPKRGNGPAPTA